MPDTAGEREVEVEREDDGRWLAEVTALPGVLAYGATAEDAIAKSEALARRVLAERCANQASAASSSSTSGRRRL